MNPPELNPLIPPSGMPDPKPVAPPPLESVSSSGPPQGLGGLVDALLRQPRRVFQSHTPGDTARVAAGLLTVSLVGAGVYGLVLGSFSGGAQYWEAPVKIVLGLALTSVICLPSLYVFGALGGASARLREVGVLVCGLLALMTVLLLGFAPVAWVFSQSTESLVAMGVLHLGFWLTAVIFGLRFLSQGFRHLQGTSGVGLKVWMLIYVVVSLQMSTALRPLLAPSRTFLPVEKKFFLGHWADCIKGR